MEIESEVYQIYKEYNKNFEWYQRNIEKLKREHADEIVLVHKGIVIFSDEDPERAIQKLRSLEHKEKCQVFSQYVPKENEVIICL